MGNLFTNDKKTGSRKCKIGIRIATPAIFTKKNIASCLTRWARAGIRIGPVAIPDEITAHCADERNRPRDDQRSPKKGCQQVHHAKINNCADDPDGQKLQEPRPLDGICYDYCHANPNFCLKYGIVWDKPSSRLNFGSHPRIDLARVMSGWRR